MELAGRPEGKKSSYQTVYEGGEKTMPTAKEIRKQCQKVEKPKVEVELPPGYELWDDEHFVHLLCGGEVVATFHAEVVDFREISQTAFGHFQGRQ